MDLSRSCHISASANQSAVIRAKVFRRWMMTKLFTIASSALNRRSHLSLAGATCEFATNSEDLHSALQPWCCSEESHPPVQFTMDTMVCEESMQPRRPPHFRGLHHVVVASFGDSDVFIFDLLRRKVSSMVSRTTAQDVRFWNATILPLTLGVLGATVGVLPVHCACLSLNREGMLIAGASGAGKSTLSIALAQSGLDFVSDDWTYISYHQHRLSADGMSAPAKLLPDAIRYFPVLEHHSLRHALDGELAYEVTAADVGINAIRCCEPRWVLFPERLDILHSELVPVPTGQTRAYLESNVEFLPPQLATAALKREGLMMRLSELPCWKFRYGGTPQFAAQELRRLFAIAVGATA